jgi:hypothetical protein
VFTVRGVLEARRDFIAVPVDLDNAFNEMSRAATVEVFEAEESLRHMAQFFGVTLAPTFPLEAGGQLWESRHGMAEGGAQGSPDAGAAFSVGLQPSLVRLDRACRAGGGCAFGGADDLYPTGPPHIVIPALLEFQREVKERCGLTLNMKKTKVFSWDGEVPAGSPAWLRLAGEEVDGEWLQGFLCYGCPVGEDRYVSFKLKEVADRILADAARSVEVLGRDRQALWSALRASINQRFDYWCQLVRPSLARPVAAYLDRQTWCVLEAAVGFRVPRAGQLLEEGADFLVPVPVCGLEARPFPEWGVRQPVRLHGAGLRSHEDNCFPAYVGALEQAAAFMAEVPALQEALGGEGAWGEDADPATRWEPLLNSGLRDGEELRAAVASLQQEAREAATFLGEEVEGVLADRMGGFGKDTTGSTRQAIVVQRETARGRLLLQGLEQMPNREARPVWSWPERDKHSAAWLLCLPQPETSFSAQEFSEAFAAFLCQPSPACRPRVGEAVPGRQKVCKWGDTVVNTTMRGDGWRRRHDAVKLRLLALHRWAGVPAVCEVFNQFADLIPQDGLSRIERGRRRQALVPDFKVPGEQGEGSILCELKCMSASKSRYPRNPRPRNGVRAADRRADGLSANYATKARNIDHDHCGIPRLPPAEPGAPRFPPPPPRQVGPVETRLLTFGRIRGWCFGAWGEVSEDVHSLVQRLAQARVQVAGLQPGRQGPVRSREAKLTGLVGYVRRDLAFTAVREQARLLLDRLELLGDGATQAARRRDWAVRLEAVAIKERRAQDVCLRQGRAIRRHGFGKLD